LLLITIIIACFFALKIILSQFGPKKAIIRYGSVIIVSVISLALVYDCIFGITTEEIKVYQLHDPRVSGTNFNLRLEDNNNNIYWAFLPMSRIDTSYPLKITYLKLSKYIYKVYGYDEPTNRYIEIFDHHFGLLVVGSGFYLFVGFLIYYYIKSKKKKTT